MDKLKKNHVCIDARMINNSGIGVYIQKYVAYLLDCNKYDVSIIGRKAEVLQHMGNHRQWTHIEANFPIYSVKEQYNLPFLIPKSDVFWSPHYNVPLAPIKAKKRLVTVPDVFHLAHLESLTTAQKLYARVITNAAVRLADKITTISSFSKEEIIKYTRVSPQKISTILLGIDNDLYKQQSDSRLRELVSSKYTLPSTYILFVGNVKPNKNLKALVNALPLLNAPFRDLPLVIVGKKEGFIMQDTSLFAEIENNDSLKKRVRFTGYVEREHLPVIYSMASLFAFPSLYEGFGFPPLEAMACGCPVVASNRASIPEICGNAVKYFNPEQADSIVESITTVLTDEELRRDMISKGLKKVAEYNWLDSQILFEKEVSRLCMIN